MSKTVPITTTKGIEFAVSKRHTALNKRTPRQRFELKQLLSQEVRKALEFDVEREKPRGKSRGRMKEIVLLAVKIGNVKAAKRFGLHVQTVKNNRARLAREGVVSPAYAAWNKGKRKYSYALQCKCINYALALAASDETVEVKTLAFGEPRTVVRKKWARSTAFIEAGKKFGLNGLSLYYMWSRGEVSLPNNPAPSSAYQPSASQPPIPPANDARDTPQHP